jgi:hypothetical protein
MRLEIASNKAVKYACMNFHYAKRIPSGANISYSVFNNNYEFCGVIIFGYPATPNILPQFNLKNGQVLELRRVALNSKHGLTSKVLAIAIRLVKKSCPLLKVLVSYSDKGQNHFGTIYQATNWYFIDESKSSGIEYLINGKWVHSRHGKGNVKRILPGKRKYIYPLDKSLIPLCKSLAKPYPKKELNAQIEKGISSDIPV